MKKISIIIINYNGSFVLFQCLLSLQQQFHRVSEVIIVDNASKDNSIKQIDNLLNNIKVIQLSKNLGFTGGNIEGLKQATGDYIVLLNNDTEVDQNWIKKLVTIMESNDNIGICASKMIAYGTNVIDSAGDGCTKTGRGFKIGEGKDESLFKTDYFSFGACGGAVMYRRKMLDEIGFFDDEFFLIYEDTDLNFRAQLAGWKCMFVHDAVVHHKVRSSIGHMSDLSVYYSVRNSSFVWIKNMPTLLKIKYFPQKIIQEILSFFYFCVKHKKYKPYFKAKLNVLKLWPKMRKKRKEVQKLRKISIKELDSMLTGLLSKEIISQKLKKFLKG